MTAGSRSRKSKYAEICQWHLASNKDGTDNLRDMFRKFCSKEQTFKDDDDDFMFDDASTHWVICVSKVMYYLLDIF